MAHIPQKKTMIVILVSNRTFSAKPHVSKRQGSSVLLTLVPGLFMQTLNKGLSIHHLEPSPLVHKYHRGLVCACSSLSHQGLGPALPHHRCCCWVKVQRALLSPSFLLQSFSPTPSLLLPSSFLKNLWRIHWPRVYSRSMIGLSFKHSWISCQDCLVELFHIWKSI